MSILKKENKKRIEKLFLVILLYVLLMFNTKVSALTTNFELQPFSAATKNGEVIYNANTWDVFKSRTKEEIGAKYNAIPEVGPTYVDGDRTTYYDVAPIAPLYPTGAGIYSEGRITQDTINVMTAEANYYRWLMGYSELRGVGSNTSSASLQLQKEALARRYNIGHYLDDANKPSDFPQSQWDETKNFTHNILAWGYTPRASIAGWISEGYDEDTGTFETGSYIGHRVAIIDPTIVNIDFGYVGEKKAGSMTSAQEYLGETAIGRIYRDDSANSDVAYGAFPVPGYMPMNDINSNESTWSIALNPSILKVTNAANVQVKVTNLGNNSSYVCTVANGKLQYYDSIYNTNKTPAYYVPYLNYIQPDYNYGDRYKIEVTGLVDSNNQSAKIEYETELFDVRDYEPSNVARVDVKKDFSELYLNNSSANNLEAIIKLLPTEATIITDRNQTIDAKLGEWTIDKGNKRFVTSIDKSQLSSYINDPNNVLDNIIIEYDDVSYNRGSFSVSNNNPNENDSGTITLNRINFSNLSEADVREVSIYQIANDKATVRFNKSSSNLNQSEANKYIFNINKFTSDDTGTWIGTYKIYNYLFVAGVEDITVKTKEPVKINPTYTIPTGLTANYGDALSNITLPEGFTWKDESLSVGDVGTNKFYVTYTPEDLTKYNIVENIQVNVKVNKINPTYQVPTELHGEYSDKLSTITLPEGFTWKDSNIVLNSTGIKTYKATYTPSDTKNYNVVNDIDIEVSVYKKYLEIPTLENTNFTYNFKEQEVKLVGYDSNTMILGGYNKGTTSGTYTVEVSLKDTNNYIWRDNTSGKQTLDWNIAKIDKIVVEITGNTKSVIYSGEEETVKGYKYTSSNSQYTDKDFTFKGNAEVKAINVGTYQMGLTQNDFENKNTNISSVDFIITDGSLKITAKENLKISGLVYQNKEYDGKINTPTGELKVQGNKVPVSDLEVIYEKLNNDIWEVISSNTAYSKGRYRITYKIPNSNRTYEGSISYEFEITKKKLAIPTLVNRTFAYDKTEKEITINNIDSNLMTISGDTNKTESGDYKVIVSLNNPEDYSWSNSQSNDIELTWKIEPIKNVTVTIKGNNKRVLYDGEEQIVEGYTFNTNNNLLTEDDFVFTGSTTISGTELGTYYMNLNKNQFNLINNNFQNVTFQIEDGYLLITEKTPLSISGLLYNNKAYTGNPYIPSGNLIIQDNSLSIDDLVILYEGISGTNYNSSTAPTNVGDYKVTYSIPEDNEFYTGSVTYVFSIIKATPNIELPTGLVAERNTRLMNVTLPTGFAWKDDYELLPGLNTYSAIYIPNDINNYQTLDNLQLEVLVNDYRIEENELNYIVGQSRGLKFTFVAENVNVDSIIINDEVLDEEYYTIENNTITISEDYISKFKLGSYSIEVLLEDGEKIIKSFTMKQATIKEEKPKEEDKIEIEEVTDEENPKTGDNIIISIWLFIIGLITLLYTNINKKFN